MKLVTTLVHLSQAMRTLSNKLRSKAITAIRTALDDIEVELKDVEAARSEAMTKTYTEYYALKGEADAELNAIIEKAKRKHCVKVTKIEHEMREKRKVAALLSKGVVTELVQNRASLKRELDHLTK